MTPDERPDQTFTDFMVNCMEGEDSTVSAILCIRRADGTLGYRTFNQEVADTLGMLRVTTLSVEQDLIEAWRDG